MSLTLNEIKDKFPNWVGEIYNNMLHVYKSSGLSIGCLYQDKTRCIYEGYIFNGYAYTISLNELENAEFLSHFKHKHLLTIKIDSYTRHIYVLQRIL